MKKILVAFVCSIGAVACGDGRPAEDPSTRTTSMTTEVTSTTAAPRKNVSAGTTHGTTNAADGTRSIATTGVNADGREGDRTAEGSGTPGGVQLGNLDGKAGSTVSGSTNASGAGSAPSTNNPGVASGTEDADNTKINDRDRHGALTPTDQGGGKDRDITAAIRRAVVGDGALSFTAKNVKIITVGGKVTLRGPVKSDAEKTAIEAKAKATAGVAEVDNQLEVKK